MLSYYEDTASTLPFFNLASCTVFSEISVMQTRPLGKTGLNLSIVSYGAASIGNEYGNLDEAQGIRSLHVALDGGVNFIDTSPYSVLTTQPPSVFSTQNVCRLADISVFQIL